MRGGAFLNGKEGRVGFRTNSTEQGGYIPNPYGRDLGLGYRVRTLPQGFLSPARGTEGIVKTIERRNSNRNMILGRRSTISIVH